VALYFNLTLHSAITTLHCATPCWSHFSCTSGLPRCQRPAWQMEGLEVAVAFQEVIDNAVRAGATRMMFELLGELGETQGGGPVTGLRCRDNGVSSTFEVYCRLKASCFSATCRACGSYACTPVWPFNELGCTSWSCWDMHPFLSGMSKVSASHPGSHSTGACRMSRPECRTRRPSTTCAWHTQTAAS
jgi:hypothetical protein